MNSKIIIGVDFTENKRRFHNVGNKSVRFLINKLFKSEVKDIMTGYRAFSKPFVKNFADLILLAPSNSLLPIKNE